MFMEHGLVHDGNKYVGEFKHGMFHGQGTLHFSLMEVRYFGRIQGWITDGTE